MRGSLTSAAVAVALVLGAWATPAPNAARAQRIPTDDFAIQRFVPAPGAGNYLMVEGATVGKHLVPTIGLVVDYARSPFVLRAATCLGGNADCSVERATKVDIVSYQLTFDAMATLALFGNLQLGLVIPMIASAGDSFFTPTPNLADDYIDIRGGRAFSLGDPRLSAKLRLTDPSARLGLAVVAFATAPVGEGLADGHRLGDEGITTGAHLVLEAGAPGLRFAINVGARYRPERQLLSTEVGPELMWGAAAGWNLTPLLRLIGEISGANRLNAELDENPIEARLAGELGVGDFALLLGGGTGLVGGVGVPDVRVLAGIGYRPQAVDRDGDGLSDRKDACPTEPEDRDGHQDTDGCPDADNDGDRLPDPVDRCPNEPEDRDGHHDEDGCPDDDDDGDGISDGYDSCPGQPEDKDGDRDDDGCPEDDRDRDGVPDATDKCPEQPEDTDGFGDEDGCPESDFDQDELPDDEDQCPDQSEDRDGYQDDDGCPEENPAPASPSRSRPRARR